MKSYRLLSIGRWLLVALHVWTWDIGPREVAHRHTIRWFISLPLWGRCVDRIWRNLPLYDDTGLTRPVTLCSEQVRGTVKIRGPLHAAVYRPDTFHDLHPYRGRYISLCIAIGLEHEPYK